MTSKYSYEPRTRAQFHRDPQAQKLLRQFMKNGGEGGGAGRTDEFRAGYVYAFEMSEEEKRAVDALRAENELSFSEAVSIVEGRRKSKRLGDRNPYEEKP